MQMRMLVQISTPRMQDTGHTQVAGPEVLGIFRKLHHRRIGRVEDRSVAVARMTADEAANLLWYGEGDHEVGAGQQASLLFLEPSSRLMTLARRTVAIAT